jgi:diguanylate cyclase (GGDEF)-like protein
VTEDVTVRGKNRAVLYLILAGIGVAISICGAGWLHYSAARHLNESREWVEKSQTIASNLQIESQRIDRIEPAIELYLLTHDEDKYHSAQTNSVALYSNSLYLQQLLKDNPSQMQRAKQLTNQASTLVTTINALTLRSSLPSLQLLSCRETLTLMQEAERELLQQRTNQTRFEAFRSELLSISFTVFSLIIVLVLFGFLLRDVHHRQRYQKQLSDANDKLGGTIRALERQARESHLLTASRDELQLCVNVQEAQQITARSLHQLLPGTLGSVCLINNPRQLVEIAAAWNGATALLDGFSLDACCGLRSGRVRWRKSGQSEVHCSHFTDTPPDHYVCLPLAAHGETLGMVYVECPSKGVAAMVEAQAAPLHEMIELASMAIAGLKLRNRLEYQSIRDGLTNLFNRHFMEIALERELRRAIRQQKPVAVLMVDVDHFKNFNDTFGHEAGDNVLRQVAESLRQAVRSEDIVCRYGGEEFVAILPEMPIDGALERAEMVRHQVSEINLRFRGEELHEITVSVGVAMYPQHAEFAEQLLRASDRALYEAKHQGRNRVVVASQATFV